METPGARRPAGASGPDPTAVRTRVELGAALSALRLRAGMSVRDVVRSVDGLALGTAAGWFSGQHVPTQASGAAFEEMLGVFGVTDTEPWWDAVARVRSRPGPRRTRRRPAAEPPTPEPGEAGDAAAGSPTPGPIPDSELEDDSPYPGLRPFTRREARLFYGRSAERARVLAACLAPRSTPLVIVGASGSGKSSLVAAGVCPELEEAGRTVILVRPGELDTALSDLGLTATAPEEQAEAERVLVVDQLEEVWNDEITPQRRRALLDRLIALARSGVTVVATLRADFYQSALAEPSLRAALDDDPVVLGPPSREDLAELIVEPARVLGYTVDPALVTLLLDTVAPGGHTEPGLFPLLALVLRQCWERCRRRRITVDDYYSTGGVEGAVRDTADQIYADLDPAARAATRPLFLALADLGGGHLVRRRAPLAELDADRLRAARAFAASGLLTLDEETVTPTHEILLSSWPRLTAWLDSDREGLRILSRVREGSREWDEAGRSTEALPSALATDALRTWAADPDNRAALGERETAFLAAADAHHERVRVRDRRRARALSGLSVLLAVVAIVALVTGGIALRSEREAATGRDQALSRSGAVQARSVGVKDPALGRALALAAYRISPTLEARSALLDTTRGPVPQRITGPAGPGRAVPLPGGRDFATVSADGRLRIHSTAPPRLLADVEAFPGAGDRTELYDAVPSPDGRTLVVIGIRGQDVWDVADPAAPRLLRSLPGYADPCTRGRFSPDGATLAVGCSDGTVHHWRAADLRGTAPLPDSPVRVGDTRIEDLAWLADNRTLLAADRTAGIKVVTGVGPGGQAHLAPPMLTDTPDRPYSLAVSPDGHKLAVGTTGRRILRFDLPTGGLADSRRLPDLTGWRAWISEVDWDTRGRLSAAGTDEVFRVYDPDGRELFTGPGSQNMSTARFLGSEALLTFALDGATRIWPLDWLGQYHPTDSIWQSYSTADRRTTLLGEASRSHRYTVLDTSGPAAHPAGEVNPVGGARFTAASGISPDGRVVYTGDTNGDLEVFVAPYTPGRAPVGSVHLVESTMLSAVPSPTAPLVAVCTDTGDELVLVDVAEPSRPREVSRQKLPDACTQAVFSRDGRIVGVPTVGPHTVLYDVGVPSTPRELTRLATGVGAMAMLDFDPVGDHLVTSGGDKVTTLWDLADPSAPRALAHTYSPDGEIYWVSYSADGRRVVSASSTGQATVFDVADHSALTPWAVLGATNEPILYSARPAGPDGSVLGTGVDGRLDLWQLDVDAVIRTACAEQTRLTDEEWNRYFPQAEPPVVCT